MKKKIKLNGKLSFNKETIAKLNDDQMNNIEGGTITYSVLATCECTTPQKTCPIIVSENYCPDTHYCAPTDTLRC